MSQDCIFCKIASGDAPAHTIWESDTHTAFLSIFPNTEGFSVVIPKKHVGSYVFDQQDEDIIKLMLATKQVAKLLDEKLEDVGRTGMMFEGYGVDHLHSKLFPMHGTADMSKWQKQSSDVDKYFDVYEGYISSHDYMPADQDKLVKLAKKIRSS